MKIIFWGSDQGAAAYLQGLIKVGHQVMACVTQPDRPKGRFLHLAQTPPKQIALKNGIDVLQPENLKDQGFLSTLRCYESDLFVVIAYGRILTQEILSIPKLLSLNVHPSLLPKYRGAAPINWALINGEKITGISIIKIGPELDAGDIVLQQEIRIDDYDNAVSLRDKITTQGLPLLLESIKCITSGGQDFKRQNSQLVTFARKLIKEDGLINWHQTASEIHNLVRGLVPWPGAYTLYQGKILKILESEVVSLAERELPGHVAQIFQQGFVVATALDGLLIKKVHLQASRPMDAQSFVAGHQLSQGSCFWVGS